MITEIGHYALVLALAVALIVSTLPVIGARRHDKALMDIAPIGSILMFALVGLSFAALTRAYAVSDFSVKNVWENSHSLMPMIYKLSGENLREIFQRAGFGLFFQHAAAPAVEKVGNIVGLQQRWQLCLEGFVLQELQLHIDIGVLRFEILGNLLPDGHGFRIEFHMHPFDHGCGRCRRCA